MDRRPPVAKSLPGSATVAAPFRTLLLLLILMSVSPADDLFAQQCFQTPSATNCEFGYVEEPLLTTMVSTRDGMLFGGYRVVVRDANGTPIAGREVWIFFDSETQSKQTQYVEQDAGFETVCIGQDYEECSGVPSTYAYVEGHTGQNGAVTFPLKFGGHGPPTGEKFRISIPSIQCTGCSEMPPIGITLATVPFKSTDMNADGRWNECDLSMFALCQSQGLVDQADFNLDGLVNSADLAILEADFDEPLSGCVDRTTCSEASSGTPACGTSVTYPGKVCNLEIDYVGPSEIGLTWTAPGAQGSSGTASFYTLRRSLSPITSANFSSATLISSPVPSAAGTPQSQSVTGLQSNTTYYFAIKATNSGRLVAPISNVAVVTTTGGYRASAATAPDATGVPDVLELSIANGHAVREQARVAYSVPSADAGKDGGLKVYDATGRHIRTLVSGPVEQGRHMATWDLRSDDGQVVSAGVYFARLWVGEKGLSRTLVVLAE